MAGGSIVNTWLAGFSRQSAVVSSANTPSVSPVDVAVANTAGNWLFAVISWDQSAVLTGIQFPTTITISDDAHNYWTPLTVVAPNTGVLRTSIWMAPAARPASFVFATQTGYQQAITVLIIEVTATVPWYSVSAIASTSTNAGTSITLSEPSSTSLFSVGAITYDNNTATVSFTSTGWVTWNTNATTNGTDHTSDLTTTTFVATTSGSGLTLSASSATTMNWCESIIVVQGVTNALPIPFNEIIENWPDIIVEAGCGQTLNQNWSFNAGISPWAGTNNATVAASRLFTFANSAGSLVLTPDGATANPAASSEQVTGIIPGNTYAGTAWVTVPTGWSGGAYVVIGWFTSGGVLVSFSSFTVQAVTGSLQQLTVSAIAPATTARAVLYVQLAGTPAPTVLLYAGFASLGIPSSYSNTPLDQVNWIDLSNRAITQDSIKISRGVQYENQTFEAGQLSLTLTNQDGSVTPGNALSQFYPAIGDIDVRFRVRAITPHSLTPYASLFTGFTDDYKVEYHPETKYQYAEVTCSDIWSRLTAQMVTATQQEYFEDNPSAVWPCNEAVGQPTAANILVAPSTPGPLAVTISPNGLGTGVVQAFGSSAFSSLLLGDSGATGWGLSGLGSTTSGFGASLTYFPQNPRSLPSIATGMTLQFWTNANGAGSINWNGRVVTCISAQQVLWQLTLNNPTGANPGNLLFGVFDKITNAVTNTTVLTGNNWLSFFFTSISFTATTWTVNIIQVNAAGQVIASTTNTGAANFINVFDGFIFNGINSEFATGAGLCINGTIQDVALFPFVLPAPRVGAHAFVSLTGTHGGSVNLGTGASAGPSYGDTDTQRIGAIVRYSSAPPTPLTMRSLNLPQVNNTKLLQPTGSGTDWMTPATDTNGQVASDYVTNIAASTAAALFVDGYGALNYRRRAEWYGLTQKWTLGEQAALPLNVNPFFNNNALSWVAVNATLVWVAFAGQFGTNGGVATASGAGVVTITSEDEPASPGLTYAGFSSVNALAGYTAGVFVTISFLNSGHTVISSVNSGTVPLPAGQWTYLITPTSVAPAATAFIRVILSSSGTPTIGTAFNIDSLNVQPAPGEVPYLISVKLTQDRAQLFNATAITQFGTQVATLFSGPGVRFQPTSGVVVITTNTASANVRGTIPYVSTSYLANTAQNPALFLPNTGSIEDFASWIVQTAGQPGLRAESVDITPVATPQAISMGLFSEVGDTVILNRRSLGSPTFSTITYISRLEHAIDIKSGQWDVAYQLTPNPNLQILQTDNPAFGTLDGINRLGW